MAESYSTSDLNFHNPFSTFKRPLHFHNKLAVRIGLNNALLLQLIHELVYDNQTGGETEYLCEGHWWCVASVAKWRAELLPFWSKTTIYNLLHQLEALNLIVVLQEWPVWVRVNYDAVQALGPEYANALIIEDEGGAR